MKDPTTALVIETNNLRGGAAGAARVAATLERLLDRLRRQTRPLASLDEVVVTHDGLDAAAQARLADAAGVALRFVAVPRQCGYYEAKNLGFAATRAAVVAFGDGDCWPEPDWLLRLLEPFEEDAGVQAVAGRTTYRGDLLGIAATTIDFMYFQSPLGRRCTRNFYANNVAFRRELFTANPFRPAADVYRGHCQILGLRLQAQGVPVVFEPRARTVHRFPDAAGELLRLRLLRGQDATELAPHLAAAYLPRGLRWVGGGLAVVAARFACSVRALGRQDMPEVAGARRAACLAAIAGLSALDAAGAAARAAGLTLVAGGEGRALSYHGDVDRLAS
jgi:glycosyl transferase family 2